MSTPIEKVTGIGPATATLLQNHSIHSAEDLAAQRTGDLAAIKGFNTIRAGQVIDAAKQLTGAAVANGSRQAAKLDKKDKDKRDKKQKQTKDLMKKSPKSEKKKSSKAKKESSSKKGKDKKAGRAEDKERKKKK